MQVIRLIILKKQIREGNYLLYQDFACFQKEFKKKKKWKWAPNQGPEICWLALIISSLKYVTYSNKIMFLFCDHASKLLMYLFPFFLFAFNPVYYCLVFRMVLFWCTVRKYCSSDRENFWNSRQKAENLKNIWDH